VEKGKVNGMLLALKSTLKYFKIMIHFFALLLQPKVKTNSFQTFSGNLNGVIKIFLTIFTPSNEAFKSFKE